VRWGEGAAPGAVVTRRSPVRSPAHPVVPNGSTLGADALPAIIREVRSRGYGFVTLDSIVA
jgi:hypothetical protein